MSGLKTRRAKIFKISSDALLHLIAKASEDNLPEDARVVSINQDILYNCLAIVIESKSFEEVEEGSMIPEMEESPVVSNEVIIKFKKK